MLFKQNLLVPNVVVFFQLLLASMLQFLVTDVLFWIQSRLGWSHRHNYRGEWSRPTLELNWIIKLLVPTFSSCVLQNSAEH